MQGAIGKQEIVPIEDEGILHDFYRRGYSINSIVNKVKDGTIGEYLRDIVLHGVNYGSLAKEIVMGLFEKILSSSMGRKYVAGTYLQWNDVYLYIRAFVKRAGYIRFLDDLINIRYENLEKILKIADFVDQDNTQMWMVESGLERISKNNFKSVYEAIRKKLLSEMGFLRTGLLNWVKSCEEFTLMFNVNNKESVRNDEILFKSLMELSMGQKVSAILSFVFRYGKFVYDNTPLLIDQPEDNLDNQYIYRNLIRSLRDIKMRDK